MSLVQHPKAQSCDFCVTNDASMLATFDSNCDENLISKDTVETILGHTTGDPLGNCDIVCIAFNISGQKQRFQTMHRVIKVPNFDNILFSPCRPSRDTTRLSPLELHILGRGDLSKTCDCCTADVCRLIDSSSVDQDAWSNNTAYGMHQCPPTVARLPTAKPASSSRSPHCENTQPGSDFLPSVRGPHAIGENPKSSKEGDSVKERTGEDVSQWLSAVESREFSMLQRFARAMTRAATLFLARRANQQANAPGNHEPIAGQDLQTPTKATHDDDELKPPNIAWFSSQKLTDTSHFIPSEASYRDDQTCYNEPSVSTRLSVRTNSTSSNLGDISPRTDTQEPSVRYHGEPTEVKGFLQVQGYHRETEEYIQEQQDHLQHPGPMSSSTYAYNYSEKPEIADTIGASPSNTAEEAIMCGIFPQDEGGDYIDYANEEDFPPLPLPDEYWTYDAGAQNYYHMTLEEDGSESKVWYPREFLEAHRDE